MAMNSNSCFPASRRYPAFALISLIALSALLPARAESDRERRSPLDSLPEYRLNGVRRGKDAVDSLGAQLPELARAYRMDPASFRLNLLVDDTAALDPRGRLHYTERPISRERAAAAAGAALAAAPAPLEQTFYLHSKPGAPRVLFLDFDGHVMSTNGWAQGYNGGNPINAPAWSLDATPLDFSTTERQIIQEVWQRVAEDFAPFDVDVTTQDPGYDAMARSSLADQNYGTRVLISAISSLFGNYGGISYVGAFNMVSEYYKPALVFPEKLSNNAKYIAEAASHEAGHNLGLSHDGVLGGSGYYGGQGLGDVGWAPIMGASYGKNLTQWSRGEYANANNTEDDFIVMGNSGLDLRADDHGNSPAAATVIPAGSTFAASGVLERSTDVDVFAIQAGSGVATITISPAAVGPNVDVLAKLYNASGAYLASANPSTLLSATFTYTLTAGTYYLSVEPTGYGTPSVDGYSTYGCVGTYSITGSVAPPPSVPSAPVAAFSATPISGSAPLNVSFNGSASSDAGGFITAYTWDFGDGTSGSGPTLTHLYTSIGTYTARLTVTDNQGLTGTSSTTITVQAPNTAPTASIAATVITGTAPLTIGFSGAGSRDPDGSIIAYQWSFGDGTSGSGVSVTKTYYSVGTFIAKLTVTDNQGATTSTTQTITVTQAPTVTIRVDSIVLSVKTVTSKKSTASAQVRISTLTGAPVSGVTVTGKFTGSVNTTVSAVTSSTGVATLSTPQFSTGGTVSFTVTSANKTGCTYSASQNLVTSAAKKL